MRYAILSDIHGNQYALSQVLKQVDKLGITKLLLLGDYVGYYYGIAHILKALARYEVHIIKGNHEELLERAMEEPDFLKAIDTKYGASHRLCISNLSHEQLEHLTGLPASLDLDLGGVKVLLCHGSPWDIDAYIYPDADEETKSRFDAYDFDYIFFGHTHYCTRFEMENMQVINPGSVGQSRQKGGVAYWGFLDTEKQQYEQMTTPYEVDELQKEIKMHNPELDYNQRILTR
ncbi:metallophosphoesterase family protein [Roseivirga pacifica]|uniref:metallophosphoesterase family protein n=1 Tax=Roseivirga pacifica TaxID=1267423 RepID=UPI003BAE8941